MKANLDILSFQHVKAYEENVAFVVNDFFEDEFDM